MTMPPDVVEELRALSIRYAAAMDDRDGERLAEVFDHDGALEILGPGGRVLRRIEGLEALTALPVELGRYDRTAHLLAQSDLRVAAEDGNAAVGAVWCVAHHLSTSDDAEVDHVMYIRYDDHYRRNADARWRIVTRRVDIRWTETRPIDARDGDAA